MSSERLRRAVELARARGPSPEAVARMQGSLDAGVTPKPRFGRLFAKPWLAGACIAGAAALAAIALHPRSEPREAAIVAAPVTATPPPTAKIESNDKIAAPEVPTIAVDDLPRARAEERPAPKPTEPAETELALVQRAQSSLGSDPSLALSLAEKHAAKFPSGELAQEREVIAIEALAKLGRDADATARGARFLAENPHTPYRLRVERAIARTP